MFYFNHYLIIKKKPSHYRSIDFIYFTQTHNISYVRILSYLNPIFYSFVSIFGNIE